MKSIKTYALVLLLALSLAGTAFAKKTPVKGLYEYTLKNGLSVFVAENHSVPLVYIEIAVHTGAIDQTPKTAGLFHLYEHMMFKGNELYRDAASVQKAISDLGVTNWNGSTGTDCVNYFFTIPSDQLENGLAFWNAAIRSPLMDETELEKEKKVVLSEIMGDSTEPSTIVYASVIQKLFPDAPYRVDARGSFPVVENASVQDLREIQSTYYIPQNAAVFIGGDVVPKEAYKLVAEIFGSWHGDDSALVKKPQQSLEPLAKPECLVMPYSQMPPQAAQVSVMFRGPDTDYDLADTYPADYLISLEREPDGLYKTMLTGNKELLIPETNYVWAGYTTVRANGLLSFGATLLEPENNLAKRSLLFLSEIEHNVLPAIVNDESLYTKKKAKQIVRNLQNETLVASDTATGLLNNIRFWWTCASSDYYYSYAKRLGKVKQKTVKAFVDKYISGKNALILVLVNPDVYEATKAEYEALGFDVIGDTPSLWWQNERYASVTSSSSKEYTYTPDTNIYRPKGLSARSSSFKRADVKEYKLANGIPLYVLRDKNKRTATVQIAMRGGANHLTPETSGLEAATLSMMGDSSKNYSFSERQKLYYDLAASISYSTWLSGSVLSLYSLDSNLYNMLPVFVDGLLHPDWSEQVFENLLNDYHSAVQETLNDPEELLDYEASEQIYAGHPYEVSTGVTPRSIDSITLQNIKALHPVLLAKDGMFVVAVGNINARKLLRTLNKTIGKLEETSFSVEEQIEVPPVTITKETPVVLSHPAAAGGGYAKRIFAAPANTSSDYVPAILAGSIYSDIMFNVVREKNGVCYTPYSYIVGSKAPCGSEVLVSLSNYTDFAAAMAEARNLMAEGRVITGLNEAGGYTYADLSDVLQSYKNKSINSQYGSQASTESLAKNLAYNIMQFNDINRSEHLLEAIHEATPNDILRVFRTYWLEGQSRWFVIVGSDNVTDVEQALAE